MARLTLTPNLTHGHSDVLEKFKDSLRIGARGKCL
jgi:hypothetical protein